MLRVDEEEPGFSGGMVKRFCRACGVSVLEWSWEERVVETDTPHEPFVSDPELLAETLRVIIWN